MTERMYADLADWWTLLSPVDDYVEEAALFKAALLEHAPAPPRTLLELGAGGGHNAFHLKADFEMTLVDRAGDMLRQSRRINPELPHQQGDMRDLRLDEVFDAVFIHDAISYMASREDLERAMATAFVHCRPNGIALFAPDETRERFVPQTSSGGTDDGPRGFRYLEWTWDPDPDDETFIADYAFLIRDEHGEVRAVHDRHIHGLYPRQVWLDTMTAVGFEPHSKIYEHSDLERGYELFIGIKR
jgi:SAM-dependent methyltransferase